MKILLKDLVRQAAGLDLQWAARSFFRAWPILDCFVDRRIAAVATYNEAVRSSLDAYCEAMSSVEKIMQRNPTAKPYSESVYLAAVAIKQTAERHYRTERDLAQVQWYATVRAAFLTACRETDEGGSDA